MLYYFDDDGRLTTVAVDGRSTPVAPPHDAPAGQHWRWDFQRWQLVNDVPGPAVAIDAMPPNRRLTKRGFWNRFPAAKEAVIRAVRLGAPAGYLMLVGALDRLNSRVDASPYVNLSDPQTIQGINWLASVQAPEFVALDGQQYPLRLTAAEAEAILAPDPSGSEAYTG